MIKTSNNKCRQYVQDKVEFQANNIFANYINPDTYCVYSYGTHWILYMWKDGQWLGCSDKKESNSNSKHSSQANPLVHDMIKVSQQRLQELKYE
jgi:hypothetical protein